MPKLTFIRHGETTYNKEGRFTGQDDAHLTEKGILDAKAKAKEIKDDFDYVYISPLSRTKETLENILPGRKAIVDARITETCLGEWQGQIKNELDQDLLKSFREGKYTPKGAETRAEVAKRVCNFVEELFNKYGKDDKIFVVTHAGIIRAIRLYFFEEYDSNVDNLKTVTIDEKNYDYYLKNNRR